MCEFMSVEENPESLQFMCMHCDKHRNDAGYLKQVFDSFGSVPESQIGHDIFPECFYEHCSNENKSLGQKRRISAKEGFTPGSKVLSGCFFIVNNKGNLFGDYDSEQRL
jgi:hypothetical protein